MALLGLLKCASKLLFAWTVLFAANVECKRLFDPMLLSEKVRELTEHSLKIRQMQAHFDTLKFQEESLQGKELLERMVAVFEVKFRTRINAVKNLQDAVKNSYSSMATPWPLCCVETEEHKYDPRYKTDVVSERVCEQVSSSATNSHTSLSSAFTDACLQNLNNLPTIKWQYFGSEDGVLTQFPAIFTEDCYDYDNRFRPWYVQANVPKPKQVVIVIDKSGSMIKPFNGVTLMDLAKEAAKSVVATLNPYDKVAVLAFSNSPETMRATDEYAGCFSNSLAQATPQNKKRISQFIDTVYAKGGTYYASALSKAFDFLQNQQYEDQVDRVILFMSDGTPSDSSTIIFNTLESRNNQLNNSVVIMTYGVGEQDFHVLQEMASKNTEMPGQFISITDPSKLRNQMASYYKYFSVGGQFVTEPIWTVPYLDNWGLGQMITASLPVYVSNELIGVVAVDVTLHELFAESTYFKPSEMSYSFVINQEGLVINHPLFPYVSDRDSLFVKITALERDSEFVSVFDSMKRGESGNKTFVLTRILAQGDSRKYGVKAKKVVSTYYWKKIPGTKFSVCLVLAADATRTAMTSQGSLQSGSFLHHRLDLIGPENPCHHLHSYCARNQSSVFLASRAFVDPEDYLSRIFTETDVRDIASYMEGSGFNSQNIREIVKDEVVATHKAEILWTEQNENTELQSQVAWRYIGTSNGLYRIYPGTRIPLHYDPIVRPWYEHAMTNRGKNVITPPYKDAASGAVVVTFSKVLFEGRSNEVHDPDRDDVIAVMGTDIIIGYFNKIFVELYPHCGNNTYRCTLIDKAGYAITSSVNIIDDIAVKHLTEVDPEVANVLIREGIMKVVTCSNIEAGFIQRTYQISENQTEFSGTTGGNGECFSFQLLPVPLTNVLLVVKSESPVSVGCDGYQTTCACSKLCNSQRSETYCECPCLVLNPTYIPCLNEYEFNSESAPPCTPETPDLIPQDGAKEPEIELDDLPQCYNVSFFYEENEDENVISMIMSYVFVLFLLPFGYNYYRKMNKRQGESDTVSMQLRCATYGPWAQF